MPLLSSQIKYLIQSTIEKGLNWNDFSLENSSGHTMLNGELNATRIADELSINVLQHKIKIHLKKSDFVFEINHDDPDRYSGKVLYRIIYSPGEHSMTSPKFDTVDFKLVQLKFAEWLDYLERELDSQTFIENTKLNPNGNILGLNLNFDYDDQSKFSEEEQGIIEQKLNEFKQQLSIIPDLNENIYHINKKIDYLIDRSKSTSRIDWVNLAASTLISITYDVATDPLKTATVILIIKKLWDNIVPVINTLKLLG